MKDPVNIFTIISCGFRVLISALQMMCTNQICINLCPLAVHFPARVKKKKKPWENNLVSFIQFSTIRKARSASEVVKMEYDHRTRLNAERISGTAKNRSVSRETCVHTC